MIEANGNGNIIYAAAKWSGKGKDDKGKPKDLSGLATQVFEKRPDGSLKLKLKTFNGSAFGYSGLFPTGARQCSSP